MIPEQSESHPPKHQPWNKCRGCGAEGTLVYEDDEYDSLANGGSYEIYRCSACGKRKYFMLPD